MTSETLSHASPQEMAMTGLKICRRIADSWCLGFVFLGLLIFRSLYLKT